MSLSIGEPLHASLFERSVDRGLCYLILSYRIFDSHDSSNIRVFCYDASATRMLVCLPCISLSASVVAVARSGLVWQDGQHLHSKRPCREEFLFERSRRQYWQRDERLGAYAALPDRKCADTSACLHVDVNLCIFWTHCCNN